MGGRRRNKVREILSFRSKSPRPIATGSAGPGTTISAPGGLVSIPSTPPDPRCPEPIQNSGGQLLQVPLSPKGFFGSLPWVGQSASSSASFLPLPSLSKEAGSSSPAANTPEPKAGVLHSGTPLLLPDKGTSSLWKLTSEIADRKLSENNLPWPPVDRTNLTSPTSAENIIQSLIGDLEAANKRAKGRQLRYEWGGKEIIVAERLGKIIKTVEKYTKVVDTAIQHSPEITALAWAGVHLILQVVKDNCEALECYETTISIIGEKVAMCQFYAKIYGGLQLSSATDSKLQSLLASALPELYAAVIVFSSGVSQYFEGAWLKKLAKSFNDEIKSLVDEINAKEGNIKKFAEGATMERLQRMETALSDIRIEIQSLALVKEISNNTAQILDNATHLNRYLEDEKTCKLLKSLSPLEPLKRHRDISTSRAKNTGTWLLELDSFCTWSDPDCGGIQSLCCYGIPGAGKTVISSLVIDVLFSRFRHHSSIGSICIYCDYRDQSNQTFAHILGSLLYQLLTILPRISIPDGVLEQLDDLQRRNDKPDIEQVMSFLKLGILKLKCVFICIDALDELDSKTRGELLKALKDLGSNTRLFLTGRHHIENEVRKCLGTEIQQKIEISANKSDIEVYLNKQITDDHEFPDEMDPVLATEIVDTIVERSQGMFLLSALHIKTVLEMPTKSQRRFSLKALPEGLESTFTQAMLKIQDSKSSKLGMRALMMLHLAYRPLRIGEFQHALSVDPTQLDLDYDNIPSQSTIMNCCYGLVCVDSETETIRFVHFTVEEFFRKYSERYFPDGCSSFAEICLTYFHFKGVAPHCTERDVLDKKMWKFHFLHYASLYWGHYVRRQCNEDLVKSALALLNHERGLPPSFVQVLALEFPDPIDRFPMFGEFIGPEFSGIHTAAYFGLFKVSKSLFAIRERDSDLPDAKGRTPLSWAAINGHEKVAHLLLAKGADVNSKDRLGKTPLTWAAQHGHEKVVQLLLENDAVDVNSKDKYNKTPLTWAAQHGNEKVVQLLLEDGAVDVNSKNVYGQTPLSWAATNGHEKVVELLLAQGADIDVSSTTKDYGQMPLSWAARNGHEKVVQVLLAKGADVDANDNDGRTPLSWAASNGHEKVVQLLVENDAVNVDSKDEYGKTPLSRAANNGHEKVVQLLLGKDGVDVNSKDEYGQTPLSRAASNGHEKVVRLLLGNDAVDVNSTNKDYGQTLLSWAAQHGKEKVVQLLLGNDAVDINSQDEYGQTPLSRAASNGHEKVVQLLLGNDALDVNSKDDYGQTPLSRAASNGHERVVQQLLANGADSDSKDIDGRTPLSWAAEQGHGEVMQLLLAKGADGDSKDNDGKTPIAWAVENGHEKMVQLLLARRL